MGDKLLIFMKFHSKIFIKLDKITAIGRAPSLQKTAEISPFEVELFEF
jgi:hypothetical protein